ncbi:hypothetical protein ACFFGH_27865 [Lysobacter korlensis]|uniref:Uncharacterized protein n=1 Tax=Lysobacter korlensis TaxID=553636 RepID=A0ABV6RXF2_9GAMM
MSFPEGPPTDAPQRYATDGRDAEGTSPTAEPEDSTSAALQSKDPSATVIGAAAAARPTAEAHPGGDPDDLDQADRDQTDQDDTQSKRASKPGGALGPGNTATGAGTSLD